MTHITIDFYKPSGKWYTTMQFSVWTPVYETTKLKEMAEVEYASLAETMSYTVHAIDDNNAINRFIVHK